MATTVTSWRELGGAKRGGGNVLGENDVYIGREMPAFKMHGSVWANPYRIGPDGTREMVIARYELYIRAQLNAFPDLRQQLLALKDKRLICWCHPLSCHGDVLVKLIAEYEAWLAAHPGKH